MHGLLVIDKPVGLTSHDVVARVRRAIGTTKVGHTGTLDPMATGVLPLVVGRATRLARFFSASEKEYEAEIRLGWATDTYDACGTPVGGDTACQMVPWPESDALEPILDRFRGSYLQAPPRYSAKKIAGVRAYALARQGRDVVPADVPVTAHEVSFLGSDADRLRVRIRCSAGFYVRSFAHGLGLAVGPGAHLSSLRRTRSGNMGLETAVRLSEIEDDPATAATALVPMERLLPWLPAVIVRAGGAERARHGNSLQASDWLQPPEAGTDCVRVFDEQGVLLALAERSADGTVLRPCLVVV